jgi:hypothetical protein
VVHHVGEEEQQVERAERVAEVDHEVAAPRPGEVGVRLRRDPHLAQHERGPQRPGQPDVRRDHDEQQRTDHDDRRAGQVAVHQTGHQQRHHDRAEHRAEHLADPDQTTDRCPLANRNLVRHHRGETGQHPVQAGLDEAPADGHHRDARGVGQHDETRRADQRTRERPRVAAAEPRRGAVRQQADDRVREQRRDGARTRDQAEHQFLVGLVEQFGLLREQHLDGRVDPEPQPQVGQEQPRHPAAANRDDRFAERLSCRRR